MPSFLFGQLDRSLHSRLGYLIQQAERGDDDTVRDLARVELPKMVTALRALLDEHRPDDRGRCPTCRSKRFSRRLPAPCRAYLAAHLCLVIAEDSNSRFERPGRAAQSGRRGFPATPHGRRELRHAG